MADNNTDLDKGSCLIFINWEIKIVSGVYPANEAWSLNWCHFVA